MMSPNVEAALIAARLAAASECFPLPHSDVDGKAVRASAVFVDATDKVIRITVEDADGGKREYIARVEQVSETAPEIPALAHRAGADQNHPSPK